MTLALLASEQPGEALKLAARWSAAGDHVTVVLLDGATALLRPGHAAGAHLATAQDAGVTIWAHDEAVRERALDTAGTKFEIVDLDRVVALIGDAGTKVQWW
jgi:hypothetical protein